MSRTPAERGFLYQPLRSVVGGKTATVLQKSFGMTTVEDLLRHYPRRYAMRGELTELTSLRDGENVTVMAEVAEVTSRPMRNRRGSIIEVIVTDGRERMSLTFFNQPWRAKTLVPGVQGLFAGQVSTYRGRRQLAHPECELFSDGLDAHPLAVEAFAGALIPIYPASGAITTWSLAKAIGTLLDQMGQLPDPIPETVRASHDLVGLAEALYLIHRPPNREAIKQAERRLRFEEAFVLQVVLAQRRAELEALPAVRRVPQSSPLVDAFDTSLPFTLTAGQVEVAHEIEADLARSHPMHRLLQGDVGSGKTVVALRAMLRVVDAGGQAALLAPTEVLAAQHFRSISALLGPLGRRGQLDGSEIGTRVALLTGSLKKSQKRSELLDILTGDAGIVVGTHALIQEHVDFNDLALVVVDEQHRFGVEQRAALTAKSRDGNRPHVLVMTATPIPRTVAMTVFGDVDVSTLSELPAGRAPIVTHVVVRQENPALVARTWQRVREEVEAGRRVYVVCPRIGDGDEDTPDDGVDLEPPTDDQGPAELTGVVPLAASLAQNELAGLRIDVMHGRLSGEQKDDVMRRFADVEARDGIDVLVSTTVIEVGVDVPAASTMVIMDAERFGISQLHQLRGRVGRGGLPGLCLLLTSAEVGTAARERLDAVASTTDGFTLSALDLEIRREGDVLGSMQSGTRSSLRLLEVTRDEDIIIGARADAIAVMADDPTLREFPALAEAVDHLRQDEHSDYLDKA